MQQFYIQLWRGSGGVWRAGMLSLTKDLTLFNLSTMWPNCISRLCASGLEAILIHQGLGSTKSTSSGPYIFGLLPSYLKDKRSRHIRVLTYLWYTFKYILLAKLLSLTEAIVVVILDSTLLYWIVSLLLISLLLDHSLKQSNSTYSIFH